MWKYSDKTFKNYPSKHRRMYLISSEKIFLHIALNMYFNFYKVPAKIIKA